MHKSLTHKPIDFGWWIEIFTVHPFCLYYFGCFDSRSEAELAQAGYIENLIREGAIIVAVQTKRCQPKQVTLSQHELSASDFELIKRCTPLALAGEFQSLTVPGI